jgi:hypothetical protein
LAARDARANDFARIKDMKLISIDKLTQEERQKLAAAALKVRPTAKQRAEFRWLTQRRKIT